MTLAAVLLLTLLVIAVLAAGRLRSRSAAGGQGLPAVAIAVALLAAVALPFASLSESSAKRGRAAVPKVFWGVIPADQPTGADFDRMQRAKIDSLRYLMAWDQIERSNGNFDWAYFDDIVAGSARRGIEVLPVIYGSPSWVAPSINTIPVDNGAQRRAWKGFLQAALRRYGSRGQFWNANPSVPKRPVRFLQIWNEQNIPLYAGRVSPAEYATLLRISRQATVAVDRRVKLVLGGMLGEPFADPPRAYSAPEFLDRLYRFKGTRNAFTAVALHPYAAFAKDLKPQLEALRRVLKKRKDLGKQIWITEIGWGSDPRPNPPPRFDDLLRGRDGQARQLRLAFAFMKNNHARYRLKRVHWYTFRDGPPVEGCSFCDNVGLLERDSSAKPAWFQYVRFSGGRP